MRVIQTIQSAFGQPKIGPNPNEPVEQVYYRGDDLAAAMASVVNAMGHAHGDREFVNVLSVRVEF